MDNSNMPGYACRRTSLPLTLTLSPREREQHVAVCDRFKVKGFGAQAPTELREA
jgi:hypothetical protein